MLKKILDIIWVICLIIIAIFYFFLAYDILDYFNIGADGS